MQKTQKEERPLQESDLWGYFSQRPSLLNKGKNWWKIIKKLAQV